MHRLLIVLITALALNCAGTASGAQDAAPGQIPVLLIGGQNNHDWQKSNAFLMALFSHQAGLHVVESNSPPENAAKDAWAGWNPDFSAYRCVLLNYNGQQWPEPLRAAFEKYIEEGGTAIVLHAANNSFSGWAFFERAVGLLWRGKEFGESLYYDAQGMLVHEAPGQGRPMGHGGQYDWRMTVRDTTHPITAGMPLHWMHRLDELYHGQRGPAKDVHILLSAFSDKTKGGTGLDEPIVWWVPVGKGKVLTDVMGHVGDTACMSCVGFQTTLLRGIEWLATGRCTTTIPEDFPSEEKTSQNYPGGVAKQIKQQATIEDSLKLFKLPPGYHIELVAHEPMVINPVAFAWDGDGRMLVCEMRTYMTTPDAKGEDEPKSRVSMLVDSTGSGVYDKATAYADNLVLPRMVLPLDDRVVIAETYTGKFVSYRDTDGDGIADEHVQVYDGGPSKANLEHQDSALLYGTDNFVYSAQTGSRRFKIGADLLWTAEQIYGIGSQWGLAQDDLGRLYSSTAGGERPAFGFQQHPSYGALTLPGENADDFSEVFPRMQTVDVQGGLGRVHPIKGTLNHITGCAGQSIYRGDRLPGDLYGDYILPEPVGRLIRRGKVQVVEGKRVLVNAYPGDEFITSTDPAFRPVWTATGPDGCLYIGDLHNGIVQEGNWTRPGSYLREMIDRDGHGTYVGHGRIYRLVNDSAKPGPKPALLKQTPAQLVQYLSHPNGWWRDTAQQLIVLRHDKSVVPALRELVRSGAAPLGKVHALWTLDGLGATEKETLFAAYADADARVRATAVRISESLLHAGDAEVLAKLKAMAQDKDIDVLVQLIDSLRFSKDPAAKQLMGEISSRYVGNEIITASTQQSMRFDPDHPAPFNAQLDAATLNLAKKGRDHFTQLCFACHGQDGKGVTTNDGMRMGPSLAGSPRVLGSKECITRIVLHGLQGEVDGKTFAGFMLPMKANDDQWIAEVITYVRTSFGNAAGAVTKDDVARIRAATADRAQPFAINELATWTAVPASVMKGWTFSASLNSDRAKAAADGDMASRWDTGAGQTAGQWFQVDMGKPMTVTQWTVDCSGSNNDYPRGWEVRTSADGKTWSEPLAKGDGKEAVLAIPLAAGTVARYLRIVQTASGKTGLFWSIHEMSVYGTEKK
jgi:putative membrane-bound dehydrogenase-like protein